MILPRPSDVQFIAMLYLDKEGSLSTYRLVAAGICDNRGVRPTSVDVLDVERAFFDASSWRIVLPCARNLDFLHELAHLISFVDNGSAGSDFEAETFAHGVSLWLWPELYEDVCGMEWHDMDERELRRILWTRDYLQRISDSWKVTSSTSGS